VIVGAATISTVLYLALWNGKIQRLDQQGAVGIILDAAILAAVLLFRWPR
jgi:hypothetical protein